MGIDATVTSSQIVAAVTEGGVSVDVTGGTVAVDVSGGVGPTGPQGPSGASALPAGTEGYVLTYVSGSWVAAAPSGAVLSVAGKTGTVTLATADITGLDTALSAKAPLASPTFTGTVSGITAAMVGLGNVANVDARARSSHTGTQLAATISDFASAVAAASPEEVIEATTVAGFPATGDTSALYVATDTSRFFRFDTVSGRYVEVGPVSSYPATHSHQASEITGGVFDTARLGTGATATNFLRGDQTYANPVTYATATQAQDSTSTTTALSPSTGREQNYAILQVIPQSGGGTGGGSIVVNAYQVYLTSSATANGSASSFLGGNGSAGFMLSTSSNSTGCDWSRPRSIEARCTRWGSSTNGVFRVMLGGKNWPWTVGALSTQGIGFEIRNRRVWIVAHNGTALAQQDTGVDVASSSGSGLGAIRVNSDGSGNVTAFVNGTQIGTTLTGGPTTNSSNACNVIYELANGGDAVETAYTVSVAKVLAS